ncbi:unnamed protein product, partial [Mesorhabditis spiculigera]
METQILQIGLLLAMGVISAIFGLIPLKLRTLPAFSMQNSPLMSLVTCFAGGVFLSVCLLDMLPEAFEQLDKVNGRLKDSKFGSYWIGLLMGVGLFFVLFVEFVTQLIFGTAGHSHGPPKPAKVLPRVSSGLTFQEELEINKEKADGSIDSLLNKNEAQGLSRSLALVFALSIHSLLEGFAFGVQTSVKSVVALFFGIMVHKAAVFFAAGFRLSSAHRIVLLPALMVCWMAVMAPLGGFAGLLVQGSQGTESNAKEALILILSCLSLGTFLQISFYELLVPEHQKDVSRIAQLGATIAGFVLIAMTIICYPED